MFMIHYLPVYVECLLKGKSHVACISKGSNRTHQVRNNHGYHQISKDKTPECNEDEKKNASTNIRSIALSLVM